jgi:hypothetical protein
MIVELVPIEARARSPRQRRMIERAELTIGRAPGCAFVLDDDVVSRVHARLRADEGRLTLVDESENGSTINGVHGWGERAIRDGDDVRIGPYRLLLWPDDGAPIAPRRQLDRVIGCASVGVVFHLGTLDIGFAPPGQSVPLHVIQVEETPHFQASPSASALVQNVVLTAPCGSLGALLAHTQLDHDEHLEVVVELEGRQAIRALGRAVSVDQCRVAEMSG